MAFSAQELLTIAGVLGMLLAVIAYNNLRAARARDAPAPISAHPPPAEGVHPIVGRYVQHEGSVVGEVVAVAGERAILRQAGVHRAVPVARLEPRGGELALVGAVDWAEAERAAADWK
ncbi:MAG: hypothetical protein QOD77_1796 [Thermoplasmata archaeon]|jgi:hypothetical protein|nr:hypothetical protein [Thermoplasmata archaeon]